FNSGKYKILMLVWGFLVDYMLGFDGVGIEMDDGKFGFWKLEEFGLWGGWGIDWLHMLVLYGVKILELKVQYVIFVTDELDVELLLLLEVTF
ncbi:hypothetical protein, partial [Staphylococcus epidermidis]|uniref:hypothetical protein n=1 Tax=Staphylococcus epidermidis TaxID=1282 RepID=UPI001642ABC9